jgi:hypothetical protein
MLGRKERDQLELFISGSLRQLIPEDHVLVRVDRLLDLSWLRQEVTDCYCLSDGRPGIDPEVAVRLMLAGLLIGVVHDRKLMREAYVNIAIRWFIGYGLGEALPDEFDPHPSTLGSRALPPDLQKNDRGVSQGQNRHRRSGSYRRLAHPGQRELG